MLFLFYVFLVFLLFFFVLVGLLVGGCVGSLVWFGFDWFGFVCW